MSHHGKLIILFLIISGSFDSASAEVYKWVDKNGKVHYSDKPIDQNAETVQVEKERSKAQQESAEATRQQLERQKKRIRTQFEAERDAKQQQEKQQQQQKAHQQQCALLNNELRTLQMKVPVYYLNDSGERVFYDDTQREKEIADLKEMIKKHCQK